MDYQTYLFIERAKSLTSHRTASLFSEFGVNAATVYILWDSFAHDRILWWSAAAVLVSLLSWWSHEDYEPTTSKLPRELWLARVVLGTFLVAFIWGLVPVFFFAPEKTSYLIFIVCIYCGYVSGALAVTFAYTPSFFAFALGISGPFAARLFYEGGELFTIIGLLMVFYVCTLSYVSGNISKLFLQTTESNYENLSLISQLTAEKETAEKATAAKSKFLAAASHDLRQPIHAVNLFLDVLQPLQADDKSRKVLKKIRQSVKGLNKMLHGLLDISKLDASAVENNPAHLTLNLIVEPLIDEHKERSSLVQIENRLDAAYLVHADPTLLERVIRNLLDNAVKYTRKGTVTISASELEDQVSLRIQDTGIGIPQDQLQAVFDEFHQLNNPERNRDKGLGLGLAIVKRLCDLAGITISLESEPGTGTTATLLIPRGVAELENQAERLPDVDLSGLHVIVIDDEADILDGMQKLLKQWGCRAAACSNMEEAEQSLRTVAKTPDMIISDFRLRGDENGVDVIEQLRNLTGRDTPAILITGDTAPDRILAARAPGITVLYKPIDGRKLRATIQSLIRTPVA